MRSAAESEVRGCLERMTNTLTHRGPDGSDIFFDGKSGIGFGHRRLSIVDLSAAGKQPMWSHSGRYCITYNGEIYNAPELRTELESRGIEGAWRGHSDTEVLLEAIEAFGLRDALSKCHGMFALGLWDAQTQQLFLVRDRLGIKPLLYTEGSFGISFASELRALFEIPSFRPRLSLSTLSSFLRFGVVPGLECIVEGVRKVPPGAIVRFDGVGAPAEVERFWRAEDVAVAGMRQPFEGDERDAIDELERRIRRSVELRMRSDVPFGAFLSGGIDSSSVVAMMQAVSSEPVRTFCIGNTASSYDESAHAESVARHLGCAHQTLMADPDDMLALVPEISRYWDEPFADSSQIPTYLVSRLTREHVTVALSGDGGDELFAGYNRHAWAPRLWALVSRLPKTARTALRGLRLMPVDDWDRLFRSLGLGDAVRLPGDKIYKISMLAEVDTAHQLYDRLRSHWADPSRVMSAVGSAGVSRDEVFAEAPFAEQMMLYDLLEYLPDDILTKVDRASMAVSLEARVPLLDHDVVELAWQFPLSLKIKGRAQKWVLRQMLGRHLPEELFDRPKTGFGVPVGQWLRGPLRGWASELLSESELGAHSIFDVQVVQDAWNTHQLGRGNHEHRLWALLMFQSWWKENQRHIEA